MSDTRLVLVAILSLAVFVLGIATLVLGLWLGYRMGRREDLVPRRSAHEAPAEFDAIDAWERRLDAGLAQPTNDTTENDILT